VDRLPQISAGPADHPLWRAVSASPDNAGLALLRAIEVAMLRRYDHEAPCLDVGCGDGLVAGLLERRPEIGLDHDPARCHTARDRRTHQWVLNADLCRIPCRDNMFRTVIANSVIEHVPDWELALAELHRVLCPSGLLLVTAPTQPKRDHLFFGRPDVSRHDGSAYREYFDRRWAHVRYADSEDWRCAVSDAGLELVDVFSYECPSTSEVIDLLMNVRLSPADWMTEAGGGHIWSRVAFTLLLPYFEKGLQQDSAGGAIFVVARKPAGDRATGPKLGRTTERGVK
jgi:SAM-dependent methyltransferase